MTYFTIYINIINLYMYFRKQYGLVGYTFEIKNKYNKGIRQIKLYMTIY